VRWTVTGIFLIKIGSSSMKKNNVLIPVDELDFSLKILPMVQRFLNPAENHLILLHVEKEPEDFHLHRPGMEDLDIFVDQAEEGLRISFADELHPIVRSLQEAGFEVTTEVQFGQPAQTIETFLARQPVDMVAMSTHRRTGLDRIVHGSVAEHLLHHNNVPLLLYHPTPETKE
jgi:nucleotide-binding universal stress UspA family protein